MNFLLFRNYEQDHENKQNICIKNKEKNWSDVLIIVATSFYLLSPRKHRLNASDDSNERKRQTIPKEFIFGEIFF